MCARERGVCLLCARETRHAQFWKIVTKILGVQTIFQIFTKTFLVNENNFQFDQHFTTKQTPVNIEKYFITKQTKPKNSIIN